MNQNFTPIDYLFEPQLQVQPGFGGLEKIEIPPYGPAVEHKIHEVVEKKLPNEVKHYVNARKETIKIPDDLMTAGVAAVSNPAFINYKPVNLPLSDARIEEGLHAPIMSSLRWLSELCLFILKQAHLTLKLIHGKLTRVVLK